MRGADSPASKPGRARHRCEMDKLSASPFGILFAGIVTDNDRCSWLSVCARCVSASLGKGDPVAWCRGRIDHFCADVRGQRLFIAALENRTVEVSAQNSRVGLAQQRYVKSHRNLLRSPHSGPHPGTPYRPIRVTGVGRHL